MDCLELDRGGWWKSWWKSSWCWWLRGWAGFKIPPTILRSGPKIWQRQG